MNKLWTGHNRNAPTPPGFPFPELPVLGIVGRDQDIRNARLEAPSFDGSLEPQHYLDWEARMNRYFEWMVRLREKYVPSTYRHRLIDRWQNVSQGSQIVSEYIDEFDDLLLRCGVREEGALTLSRFRKGLRCVYQQELFRQHVTDLDHAYQVVREMEQFELERASPPRVRPTFQRHTNQRVAPASSQRVPPFRAPEGQRQREVAPALPPPPVRSLLGPPPLTREDRGKAPIKEAAPQEGSSRIRCYNCQGMGHIASSCPHRALAIESSVPVDSSPPLVDVSYEAEADLADEYFLEEVIFGRRHVGIMSAEPVGNYGIRIIFDDLHKTGIYTWDYFYYLGTNKFTLMRNYIKTLRKYGLSREPHRRG
ncbi:hypothetical protein Taro_000312 [Colocasia esculenta]|uniref:CCHC-type domain-containing protein n=1 Tax=Colocasia esculenta TaxID=4460 RepID=A0A843T7F7_COLES|nr:hypothetical protein [Colocasia esculenta]